MPEGGTNLLSDVSLSSAGDGRTDRLAEWVCTATGDAADIAETTFAAARRVRICSAEGRALAQVFVAAAVLDALTANLTAAIAARACAPGVRAAAAAGFEASAGAAVGGDPFAWAADVLKVSAHLPLAALGLAATLARPNANPATEPLVSAALALATLAAAGAALPVAVARLLRL